MTSLTCEDLQDLLADFVSGDLSTELQTVFELHLCECPHCGDTVAMYQATITLTRTLCVCEPLPIAFEAKLRALLNG